MRKKKELPLVILKALEPYVKLKGEVFEIIDPKEHLLKIIDKEIESKFHFTIEKYQKGNNNSFQFFLTRIPKNVNDNGVFQNWIDVSSLSSQFETWLNLLKDYETVKSFFDDPITKSFQEEFFAEFEIIEDNADIEPFKISQILYLDSYLDSLGNRLLDFNSNSDELIEIKNEIQILRESLTKKSKKWVISKLSNIWAKIARQGTTFVKEFLSESKKLIIKQCSQGVIDYVLKNGNDILN